jgi:transcriptional regulator with XRE-family HTH domain
MKLGRRKGKTARELAERLGISISTVQKYTSIDRAEYEAQSLTKAKPWAALGVSRATWYRHGKPAVLAVGC